MGQIQLSCGKLAVVDDDLVDILNRHMWRSKYPRDEDE